MICKNTEIDWRGLRFVLEVARCGTLSHAARRLGVDQTTVTRYIHTLESAVGAHLFQRIEGRYRPTAAGGEVIARAERVEAEILALQEGLNENALLTGRVRLTALVSIVDGLLAPALGAFAARYPDVVLELTGANDNFSFVRRETDVALRLGRPRHGRMIGRKLADVGFAVYGAKGRTRENLSRERWVAYGESLLHLPEARWLEAHLRGGVVVQRANAVRTLAWGVATGVGLGVLPCFVGDGDAALERIDATGPMPTRELWLLIHHELASWPRIRAVVDWIDDCVAASRKRLAGF